MANKISEIWNEQKGKGNLPMNDLSLTVEQLVNEQISRIHMRIPLGFVKLFFYGKTSKLLCIEVFKQFM